MAALTLFLQLAGFMVAYCLMTVAVGVLWRRTRSPALLVAMAGSGLMVISTLIPAWHLLLPHGLPGVPMYAVVPLFGWIRIAGALAFSIGLLVWARRMLRLES